MAIQIVAIQIVAIQSAAAQSAAMMVQGMPRSNSEPLFHQSRGSDGIEEIVNAARRPAEDREPGAQVSERLEPLLQGSRSPLVFRAVGLRKAYPAISGSHRPGAASTELELFRGLDLDIRFGEMVAIVGESGAGKSSLLHLLAALDTPSAGDVWCGETRLGSLSPKAAAEYRNRSIGYVWQFHYLLPEFTAAENVALPLLARGLARAPALEKARGWLLKVGLEDRAEHRSGELSGGEQQRVSLARALVTEPSVLLADEPTGDLDSRTAEAVFSLIQRLHAAHGLTSVLVTHSTEFASRCDRVLRLKDGRLHV